MRKLIYSMTASLDGFIAGRDGEIDWSAPDEELFRFHSRQTRELGVHLCGRRLYETMLYWETAEENPSAAESYSSASSRASGRRCRRLSSRGPSRRSRAMRGWSGTTLPTRSQSSRTNRVRIWPSAALAWPPPHEAGSHRRVPPFHQPGRPGYRHALLPGPGRADQSGAGRDTDLCLSCRLRSLPGLSRTLGFASGRVPLRSGCAPNSPLAVAAVAAGWTARRAPKAPDHRPACRPGTLGQRARGLAFAGPAAGVQAPAGPSRGRSRIRPRRGTAAPLPKSKVALADLRLAFRVRNRVALRGRGANHRRALSLTAWRGRYARATAPLLEAVPKEKRRPGPIIVGSRVPRCAAVGGRHKPRLRVGLLRGEPVDPVLEEAAL